MRDVLDAASRVTVAIALVASAVVLVRAPGSWRIAVAIGLEMALAAGLLRLGADTSWAAIATIAAIAGLRQLVGGRLTVVRLHRGP